MYPGIRSDLMRMPVQRGELSLRAATCSHERLGVLSRSSSRAGVCSRVCIPSLHLADQTPLLAGGVPGRICNICCPAVAAFDPSAVFVSPVSHARHRRVLLRASSVMPNGTGDRPSRLAGGSTGPGPGLGERPWSVHRETASLFLADALGNE